MINHKDDCDCFECKLPDFIPTKLTPAEQKVVEEAKQKIYHLEATAGALEFELGVEKVLTSLLLAHRADKEAAVIAEREYAIAIVSSKIWSIPKEERQGTGMGWHNKDIKDILLALTPKDPLLTKPTE